MSNSDWVVDDIDWTPVSSDSVEYDPTWPYNWKWGVSKDNQVSVWRAKGGLDGRPTHRVELRKLWGREIQVQDGDVIGLATYIPAEKKLDGTVVAPPLIQFQTYYGQPTPSALYQWFASHFPGVQAVEATLRKPKLSTNLPKNFNDWESWKFDDRPDYTGRTIKWVYNEQEDPPLLMWEVKGEDGVPVHQMAIEEYWGRWRQPDDYTGYGDIYNNTMEISGYTRLPAYVLQKVTEHARKNWPDVEVDTSRALLENNEPMFTDPSNVKIMSSSAQWAREHLQETLSNGSGELSKPWEYAPRVSAWGEPEEGLESLMGLGRDLEVQDGGSSYHLDEYEALLLLSEGLITPMIDYEVDDEGNPHEISGLYELTARMWDDLGLQNQSAWDYFNKILGRDGSSNEQSRWPNPDKSYFSPHFDQLLQKKKAAADMEGAMIGLFLDPPTGKKLKQPGGEPIENMHITLIYFQEKADARDDWDEVERLVEQFANQYAALDGSINGFGVFYNDEDLLWAVPSVNGLAELRSELLEAVEDAGFPVNNEHDWVPHITLKYGWADKLPELEEPLQLKFNELTFAKGEDKQSFAFQGAIEKVGAWGDDEEEQLGFHEPGYQKQLGVQQWTDRRGRHFSVGDKMWLWDTGEKYVNYPEHGNAVPVEVVGIHVGTLDASIMVKLPSGRPPEKLVSPLFLGDTPKTIPYKMAKQSAWGEASPDNEVGLNDQWVTDYMLKNAMRMWKTTDPFHPKTQRDLKNLLRIMYEKEPHKVDQLMDWFLDSYRIENDERTDAQGWVTYEPKERGSRFGFVMLAADIEELAQKARENLMARPDIDIMRQRVHPDAQAWMDDPANEGQSYEGQYENLKYDPTMHLQINRLLNYLPSELYKYYPWAVNKHKKGELPYDQLQHVRDILTQFRNHAEYLRTTPRNAPTWEATPDINQMTWADAEGWVYNRNARGIDPRSQIEWEAETKAETWDDGWYVTPVTTDNDLKQEGEVMGHCVGGYCGMVRSGETTIWSLRDSKGEPHVTFEMKPNGDNRYNVIQVQGKGDQTPKPEYQAYVAEFFDRKKQQGWDISSSSNIETVWDLEEWYNNQYGVDGADLDAYGLQSDMYFDYGSVAREIVDDAVSYGGDPDDDIIRAYEAAAEKMGYYDSRQAQYELESRADDALESKRDELESELENELRGIKQQYDEYVSDMVQEENDRRYDEEGDDYEEVDDVEVESFEDWLNNNYGHDDHYWRALAYEAGDLDLYEEALNELGWSRWW